MIFWIRGSQVGSQNVSNIDRNKKSEMECLLASMFYRFWCVRGAKLGTMDLKQISPSDGALCVCVCVLSYEVMLIYVCQFVFVFHAPNFLGQFLNFFDLYTYLGTKSFRAPGRRPGARKSRGNRESFNLPRSAVAFPRFRPRFRAVGRRPNRWRPVAKINFC